MGIRVTKNVQLDDSELTAHLHDYSKVLGLDLGEVVRDQAGLFCMDLAKYTGPFSGPGKGLESGAKTKGQENVRKALFTIFQPIKNATKEQVSGMGSFEVFKLWTKEHGEQSSGGTKQDKWDAFRNKYPPRRSVVYVGSDQTLMKNIHHKLRKYEGKGGLMDYAKKSKSSFAFTRNEKDIERYMKEKWKDIGSLKAGYWYASQKIRAKSVKAPAWIKHTKGQSYAIGIDQIQQPMKPETTVGNLVGFRAMPRSLLKTAINYRMYAMRVKMAAELNKKKIPLWVATAKGLTTNTYKHF
jgi:hypothetical protein